MAIIDGMNVAGFHMNGDTYGGLAAMQTCGQFEIGGFNCFNGKPEEFITKLVNKSYCGGPSCNIVFSITGDKLLPNVYLTPLLKYLLEHKNTRVMHWYANDAHGPNWIFLCIFHKQNKVFDTASPGYTVQEIRDRLTYNMGVYGMKEKQCPT